jgi:hypothetical protein
MRTWRERIAGLLRQWRVARGERRRIDDQLADQHAAEELDRGPATRFPPHH